jgi:predicted ATPase
MDWSYELLSESQRALLRQLSVFGGGFSLEAAERVSSDCGSRIAVLDLLTQLVDRSLVNVEDQAGEARYRLLETVRQYSGDRLREAGEGRQTPGLPQDGCLSLEEPAETK